jgi:hypothetical protein
VASPLITWVVFVFIFATKMYLKKTFSLSIFIRRVEFFFALTFTTFFTLSISTLASSLNCARQLDGTYSLVEQSSITCFEGSWSKNFGGIVFFSVLHLLVFPGWLLWAFYRFNVELNSDDKVYTPARHLFFLRRHYKKKYYWWSGVEVLKRLTVFLSSGFLNGKTAYLFVTSTFLSLFLLIDISFMQYECARHLRIALLFNTISLIIVQAEAQVFRTGELDSNIHFGLSVVLIAAVCCSCVGVIGLQLYRYKSQEISMSLEFQDVSDSFLAELRSGTLGAYKIKLDGDHSNLSGEILSAKVFLELKKHKQYEDEAAVEILQVDAFEIQRASQTSLLDGRKSFKSFPS